MGVFTTAMVQFLGAESRSNGSLSNATGDLPAAGSFDPCSNPECFYVQSAWPSDELAIVGVLGTATAVVALVINALFLTACVCKPSFQRHHRTSSYWCFLVSLAVCDLLMAVFYLLLMTARYYAEILDCYWLHRVYAFYVRPLYTFSQITVTARSFLLVAASVERYVRSTDACHNLGKCLRNSQTATICLAVVLSVVVRCSAYLELQVCYSEHCSVAFAQYFVTSTEMANQRDGIYPLWRVWVRNTLAIFLPFILLAVCNSLMLSNYNKRTVILRRQSRRSRRPSVTVMAKDAAVEFTNARRLFLALITVYLATNVLNLVMIIIENFSESTLLDANMTPYRWCLAAVDVQSVLFVFAGVLRLPIYHFICNNRTSWVTKKLSYNWNAWLHTQNGNAHPNDDDDDV